MTLGNWNDPSLIEVPLDKVNLGHMARTNVLSEERVGFAMLISFGEASAELGKH